MARWFAIQERLASGNGYPEDQAYALKPGHLVVIDEAGMASTADVAKICQMVEALGGKVLLTGDHHQLAAVEQGGALGLLANDPLLQEQGAIYSLTTVRRFDAEWEQEASLRLRSGDVEVLSTYDDAGRIVAGEAEEVVAEAVEEYVAAELTGKSALLVVPTADDAAALSMRVRSELVATGRVIGSAVGLHDGTEAAMGDLIQARKNERKITDSSGAAISNRDTLIVVDVQPDGGLTARRRLAGGELGKVVNLPGDYVADNVELAYASTVHAAQGRTVDVGLVLVDGERMGAEALYVAAIRGRAMNRLYVTTEADSTALDGLSEVLGRREAELSATEVKREQDDASRSLARLGPVWADTVALIQADQHRPAVAKALGPELMGLIDADSAAPAFWSAIDQAHAQGYDVADMLKSTLQGREVTDTAQSVAQVLHYRITEHKHMAWEPAQRVGTAAVEVATTYLERSPAPEGMSLGLTRSKDLAAYALHLGGAMDRRVDELGRRVAAQAPEWATKHLGPVPHVGTTDFEEWVAKAGRVEAYREQYVEARRTDPADPIGRAPSKSRNPHRYMDWKLANEALGITREQTKDVTAMSDLALQQASQAWAAAVETAPAYVKPLLEKAHTEHRRLASSYERQRAQGQVMGPRMKALAEQVAQAEARVEDLMAQHAERQRWYEDTAEVRASAREAEAELTRRYPDAPSLGVGGEVREDMDERSGRRADSKLLAAEQQQQRTFQHEGMPMGFDR